MKKIRFYGWDIGVKTISFIELLHNTGGISLIEAKLIKEKIIDGLIVEIEFDEDKANIILNDSNQLGIHASVIE